jgi:hypothetical protein
MRNLAGVPPRLAPAKKEIEIHEQIAKSFSSLAAGCSASGLIYALCVLVGHGDGRVWEESDYGKSSAGTEKHIAIRNNVKSSWIYHTACDLITRKAKWMRNAVKSHSWLPDNAPRKALWFSVGKHSLRSRAPRTGAKTFWAKNGNCN